MMSVSWELVDGEVSELTLAKILFLTISFLYDIYYRITFLILYLRIQLVSPCFHTSPPITCLYFPFVTVFLFSFSLVTSVNMPQLHYLR